MDLIDNLLNFTDGVVTFIKDITNKGITLSKGTLVNWCKELATKLPLDICFIESELLDPYYMNHDEFQIKNNVINYNICL